MTGRSLYILVMNSLTVLSTRRPFCISLSDQPSKLSLHSTPLLSLSRFLVQYLAIRHVATRGLMWCCENLKTQVRKEINAASNPFLGNVFRYDSRSPDMQSSFRRNPLRRTPGPHAKIGLLAVRSSSGVIDCCALNSSPDQILTTCLPAIILLLLDAVLNMLSN